MVDKIEGFRHQLNYTTCNEDSTSELAALEIEKNDRLLCVTGSGGRVLNLLTANPHRVVSVDFNPKQNWLLELKISAIKNLNYDDYCRFLGLRDCSYREEIFYDVLKNDLTEHSYNYWKKNYQMIEKGVLFQGVFEKNLKKFAIYLEKYLKKEVERMLSFTDLEKQRDYYWNVWNNDYWKSFLSMIPLQDSDPAFLLFVDDEVNSNNFLYKKLEKSFTTTLVNENHFLILMLTGSYKDAKELPLYLQRNYFEQLKQNVNKIDTITDDLVSFLCALEPDNFDKFAISDVSGYMSDARFKTLIKEILRTGKNDGILCSRNIVVKREIPEKFEEFFVRNVDLEKELEASDLSFAYSFVIAKIRKR